MKRCAEELGRKIVVSAVDQTVSRWFGHVERMDEYQMARNVLTAEVCGGQVRGKPGKV